MHPLYLAPNRAEAIVPPTAPLLAEEHAKLTRNPYLRRLKAKLLAYVDVFVDNFLGLEQGPRHRRRHVLRTVLHALNKVFRPLHRQDTNQRKEFLSLKKLDTWDCSWSTCQTMLGWIVESINMTITLPPHRVARLKEIVSSIPRSKRRVGVDKWHRIHGELRSMALTLPASRDCLAKCRKPFATSKAKVSHCHQASMKPFQTSDS